MAYLKNGQFQNQKLIQLPQGSMIFFLRYYYLKKLVNILHLYVYLEHLTSLPRNYNAVEVIFMVICMFLRIFNVLHVQSAKCTVHYFLVICMFFCKFNVLNVQPVKCTVDCFVFGSPILKEPLLKRTIFKNIQVPLYVESAFYMKYVSNNK